MKHFLFALLVLVSISPIFANNDSTKETEITLTTESGDIKGTLREPATNKNNSIAIIVSGAARTDRDGNQPQTKNNSLKMLAEALVEKDIAVLNFDKRGVGQSQRAGANEAKVTLDTYVSDVKAWIEKLKTENKFEEVVLIGHGEGALISMMASLENENVSKFITIGANSKKASDVLRDQFATLPAATKATVYSTLDKLEKGEKAGDIGAQWNVLFRSSLQPYLISLYKHDPKEELKKLEIPTLIIQGDKDIQASVEDAQLLAEANTNAQKIVIENMNHVLKECDKMGQANQLQTYLKPNFPLNKDLIPAIVDFIFPQTEIETATVEVE